MRVANKNHINLTRFTADKVTAEYAKGRRTFRWVDLTNADFHGAKLDGVIFDNSRLDNADFERASLVDTHFEHAYLNGANLNAAQLQGARMNYARLVGAGLNGARLDRAVLQGAIIEGARLNGAHLEEASLVGARLVGAHLKGAHLAGGIFDRCRLDGAILDGARLSGAIFDGAILNRTQFAAVDLSPLCACTRLEHAGSSRIDWSAVALSYRHPGLKQFMIDCGIPPVFAEFMIDCAKAEGEVNIRAMIQSTFLSYGGPDEDFAHKLYEALKAAGVITFFFPETATIGRRINDEVFDRINEFDRVLLICSRSSLDRVGVVNEIQETLDREAKGGGATYLLPIMLDDYVLTDWKTKQPTLAERIGRRIIGDFRGAETDDSKFRTALARVIDALKMKPVPSSILSGGTP